MRTCACQHIPCHPRGFFFGSQISSRCGSDLNVVLRVRCEWGIFQPIPCCPTLLYIRGGASIVLRRVPVYPPLALGSFDFLSHVWIHVAIMGVENRGEYAGVVAILFLGLSWTAVMLRVYVRAFMTKAFGTDDYLVVLSLVCLFA